MHVLQVTVRERNQPPYHSEAQPRQHEAQRKHHQRPAPLRVDQRRKDVLQKANASLGYLLLDDIALAVFQYRAASHFPRAARSEATTSI